MSMYICITCTEELTSIRSPSALNKLRESIMKQPTNEKSITYVVSVHLQYIMYGKYLVCSMLYLLLCI